MKTLILRAEYTPLQEGAAPVRSYNPQDIFFYDDQLARLHSFAAVSAYLRKHPTDGVLAHMRQEFIRDEGQAKADELLPQRVVDIEHSLQLHVLRGYSSWSMVMVSLKDGHVYEHDASSKNITPESQFRRLGTYEQWLGQILGQTKQRVSLGGTLSDARDKRDAELDKMGAARIYDAFGWGSN